MSCTMTRYSSFFLIQDSAAGVRREPDELQPGGGEPGRVCNVESRRHPRQAAGRCGSFWLSNSPIEWNTNMEI